MTDQRPPLPPFTHASAIQKIRAAEDAWNSLCGSRATGTAGHDRSFEQITLLLEPDVLLPERSSLLAPRLLRPGPGCPA